jgi:hypothetical protein
VILPDTDHLTVLKYTDSERHARLHGRLLAAAPELTGTTITRIVGRHRQSTGASRFAKHAAFVGLPAGLFGRAASM